MLRLQTADFSPVEDLETLRHTGSYLQGHPDMKHIPGVDMSSGSSGTGASRWQWEWLRQESLIRKITVYMHFAVTERSRRDRSGEAAMWAGFKKLDNLVVIVDNNNLQIDGSIDAVCSPYPIDKKFEAFNFHVDQHRRK